TALDRKRAARDQGGPQVQQAVVVARLDTERATDRHGERPRLGRREDLVLEVGAESQRRVVLARVVLAREPAVEAEIDPRVEAQPELADQAEHVLARLDEAADEVAAGGQRLRGPPFGQLGAG